MNTRPQRPPLVQRFIEDCEGAPSRHAPQYILDQSAEVLAYITGLEAKASAQTTPTPTAEAVAREIHKAMWEGPANAEEEAFEMFFKEPVASILQRALDARPVDRLREALLEVFGCFQAAYAEGLHERLMDAESKEPGSLADLVQRRLLWAYEKTIPAALAASAAEEGWLPIETAPKDGTTIWLGINQSETEEVEERIYAVLGHWDDATQDGVDSMGLDGGFVDDHYAGYFSQGRSFGNPDYQFDGVQPTHWKPYVEPAPPPANDNQKEAA